MRNRDTGKLAFRVRNAANKAVTIQTNTPPGVDDAPEGVWVHFAVVGRFDPTSGLYDVDLFRNGVPVGNAQKVEMGATYEPLRIGSVDVENGYAFRGLLDDVQLYDKALSAEEIAFLYEHPGEVNVTAEKTERR